MPITIDTSNDGPPKRQIIELAFGECGMAGYEFGRTPEEINDALLRLNALMREWPFSVLDFDQPDYGVGNPDEASGIPFEYLNAVSISLARRICPMMGKTQSPESKAQLASSMALLTSYAAATGMVTMPLAHDTPRGAGAEHVGLRSPFINETSEDVNGAA